MSVLVSSSGSDCSCKATVIFISVSRHIFLRKATLLTEKKIIPPPPKKNPNTLTQHLVTGTQKYRLLFF